MPHLQTVAQLAKVVNVPVPYFYCRDTELAEEILKFSAPGKAKKSDCLLSWAGEYGLSRRSYGLPIGSLRRSAAPVVARTASDSIGSSCASRLMRAKLVIDENPPLGDMVRDCLGGNDQLLGNLRVAHAVKTV